MDNDEAVKVAERRPLPQRTFVSVEYPGFVNNVETAIKTMGGREKLARVVTEDIGMPVELRYRHNDLVSHPINGNVVATQNLLIKVKRRTRVPKRKDSDGRQSLLAGEAAAAAGPVETSAEIVGIIDKTVRFRSLADFQFVPAPSDPLWGFTDMLQSLDLEKIKEAGEGTLFDSSLDTRNAYIPAPFLDRKGWPSQTPLKSHASDLQKGAEEGTTITREKKAASSSKSHLPFHGIIIKYSSPTVPTEASEKAMQCAGAIPEALLAKINGILERQPVVSRNAMKLLISRSELDGMLLNVVMATVSYLMESGPWRSCWIRFGYDPRQHEEACKYQILDMRTLFAKENIGRRRGNMPETSRSQQAPKQPRNPVQAQSYIYDMEAARQGIAGIFQLINVDIPILNELIEYPGGRRRSSCEKSGWLHISLSNTIRRKSRLLKQSLDGSANAAKDLPIDHAELENMLRADRRNEKADAAIETMVREREASARGGQLSQTMRSHVDAHVEQLMSQLAAQGNVLAEASNGHTGTFDSAAVYDGDGIGDGNGDFDDYNIFGEEEPSDDED
ncbi:tau 95 subunit of transcription factor TFIIIC [Coemansia sp. RSA 1285]|nr:tau 95 subunit of transcription factor TFIIIC [Coemansia sp. RSA 1285]